RVDEQRAGPLAAQLDEVGALAVAVARGAFGVGRDGAGAGGECGGRGLQALTGADHRRGALAGLVHGDQGRALLLGRICHVRHVMPSPPGSAYGARSSDRSVTALTGAGPAPSRPRAAVPGRLRSW